MLVVSAAAVFGTLLIQEGGAMWVDLMAPLAGNLEVVLLLIPVVVLVLGCFMEALAIMFLIAPVLMPLVLISIFFPSLILYIPNTLMP